MSCQRTSCYRGRTGGLKAMIDTQRTLWLQRKDRLVECQTPREHHGRRGRIGGLSAMTENTMVTEEGQVNGVL